MTGRSWSLREAQLMTVASGNVSGTMEYAAPAWLPATWPGNVERLDRDMRAVARAITGCPRSTPHGGASDGRGRPRTRSDQA